MKKSNLLQLSYFEFLDTCKVLRMLYNKETARKFYEYNALNFGVDVKNTIKKDKNGDYYYLTSKD